LIAPYFGFEIPDAGNISIVWTRTHRWFHCGEGFQNLCDPYRRFEFCDYWTSFDAELYHLLADLSISMPCSGLAMWNVRYRNN